MSSAAYPYVYLPYAQRPKLTGMTFYVRSTQDPLLLGSSLQGQVRELDANLPVYDLKTMDRVVEEDLFAARIVAVLSASFAGLAALLAALGIYGVLAYVVVQRTREIGIRMALGAGRDDVLKLFLQKGMVLASLGVVAGMVVSASTASLMGSLLYGVRPHDPAVFVIVPVLLFAVAVLASYLPARRATKVDPMIALREA